MTSKIISLKYVSEPTAFGRGRLIDAAKAVRRTSQVPGGPGTWALTGLSADTDGEPSGYPLTGQPPPSFKRIYYDYDYSCLVYNLDYQSTDEFERRFPDEESQKGALRNLLTSWLASNTGVAWNDAGPLILENRMNELTPLAWFRSGVNVTDAISPLPDNPWGISAWTGTLLGINFESDETLFAGYYPSSVATDARVNGRRSVCSNDQVHPPPAFGGGHIPTSGPPVGVQSCGIIGGLRSDATVRVVTTLEAATNYCLYVEDGYVILTADGTNTIRDAMPVSSPENPALLFSFLFNSDGSGELRINDRKPVKGTVGHGSAGTDQRFFSDDAGDYRLSAAIGDMLSFMPALTEDQYQILYQYARLAYRVGH